MRLLDWGWFCYFNWISDNIHFYSDCKKEIRATAYEYLVTNKERSKVKALTRRAFMKNMSTLSAGGRHWGKKRKLNSVAYDKTIKEDLTKKKTDNSRCRACKNSHESFCYNQMLCYLSRSTRVGQCREIKIIHWKICIKLKF